MLKVKIKGKIKFPRLTFQDDLLHIAERIVVPMMVRGIDSKISIEGGALPENEPATIKRKGHSRQLVDEGILRSAFIFKKKGKYAVLITLKKNRKLIGKYLQIDGIKTKRGFKYYKFFGISREMEKLAMGYMRKTIKKKVKRGSR